MKENTTKRDSGKEDGQWSVLEVIAREGAMLLIKQALENEIEEYISSKTAEMQNLKKSRLTIFVIAGVSAACM